MTALKLYLLEISQNELVFRDKDEDVIASCKKPYSGHGTGCPHFGETWNCPPYAPSIVDIKRQLRGVESCFLIFGTVELGNADGDNVTLYQKGRESYDDLVNHLNHFMGEARKKWQSALFLNGPPCKYCIEENIGPCTCPIEPCRFPEIWTYPPEAVGLDLYRTMEKAGHKIQKNPVYKVYRIGLACFKNKVEAHAFKEYMTDHI